LRLNTYKTVPHENWSPESIDAAKSVRVVAFASPSAVRVWARHIGTDAQAAVAMGKTTEEEARKEGFANVYSSAYGIGDKFPFFSPVFFMC
jgi:uroporphyrinogen-III synthase